MNRIPLDDKLYELIQMLKINLSFNKKKSSNY